MLELHELTGQQSMTKVRNLPTEGQKPAAPTEREKYYEKAVLKIEKSNQEFYQTHQEQFPGL